MKKILLAIGLLFFSCHIASAGMSGSVGPKEYRFKKNTGTFANKVGTQRRYSGCTFLAQYDNDLTADGSVGSPTATFSASRDATHPATYFDSSGVMQKTTTSDVGRFNYGYYDTSGWTAFTHAGLMIESASTNRITHSYSYEDASWADTNITVSDGGISAPDGSTDASTFTATAGNGTVLLTNNTGANAQTYSVFLKRKTGTGTISITADSGGNYTACTLSSTAWRRFTVSAAAAQQKCGIKIVTNTDAIYVWGSQFEDSPFASSFIPTTTAALTRNAETLKYEISGNRTEATESCALKFAPEFANDTGPTYGFVVSTDTANRGHFLTSGNDFTVYANGDVDANCKISDLINDDYAANEEMTIGTAIQHSSPYIAGYWNGVADGTNETADDFTNNAWGTYFWVGSMKGDENQLNGTILGIAFFDRVKATTDFADLHNPDINWKRCGFFN